MRAVWAQEMFMLTTQIIMREGISSLDDKSSKVIKEYPKYYTRVNVSDNSVIHKPSHISVI